MTSREDCKKKHCNNETYGSMSFLTYYFVVLLTLSVFSFACLVFC